jgi:hypothetical protein
MRYIFLENLDLRKSLLSPSWLCIALQCNIEPPDGALVRRPRVDQSNINIRSQKEVSLAAWLRKCMYNPAIQVQVLGTRICVLIILIQNHCRGFPYCIPFKRNIRSQILPQDLPLLQYPHQEVNVWATRDPFK